MKLFSSTNMIVSLIITLLVIPSINYAQISPKPKKTTTKGVIAKNDNKKTDKPKTNKFVITDSSLKHWFYKASASDDLNYGEIKSDLGGNLYCVVTKKSDNSQSQVLRLENGYYKYWEVFETGITDKKYMYLEHDGFGNLFIKSMDGLYKLGDNKWEQIFLWQKGIENSVPRPKADGALYARVTDWNSTFKNTSIVKFDKGNLTQLGKNGSPLQLMSSDDLFVVGRDGTIYSYYSHPSHISSNSKITTVYRWDGNEWKATGTMPHKITYIDFDNNNTLYAAGSDKGDWFFKKWDGKNWTDVVLPSGINKGTVYHPIFDEKKNVYVEGKIGIDKVLYKLMNGVWVEQAKDGMDLKFSVSNYIPAGGKIYASGGVFGARENWNNIYLYDPTWIVTKSEVEYIPRQKDITLSSSYSSMISDYYLFESAGKKGVQNRKGETIIYPVFDKIQVVKTPSKCLTGINIPNAVLTSLTEYAFELTTGSESIYIKFPYYEKNVNKLQCFFKRPNRVCGACKGTGTIGGGERTKEIKGDWVKGEVKYRDKLTINGWVTERTETQGYNKPSKFETEKIPGKLCSNCRGDKVVWEYDTYYYDKAIGKYIQSWEQYLKL